MSLGESLWWVAGYISATELASALPVPLAPPFFRTSNVVPQHESAGAAWQPAFPSLLNTADALKGQMPKPDLASSRECDVDLKVRSWLRLASSWSLDRRSMLLLCSSPGNRAVYMTLPPRLPGTQLRTEGALVVVAFTRRASGFHVWREAIIDLPSGNLPL